MISPELLRRYPFFGHLSDAHLKAVAMLADEQMVQTGETLFEIERPADCFYFLIEGSVDLHYVVADRDHPDLRKDFFVGQVNPGEPFGISAFVEPYVYTATALANSPCRVLKIAADGLRKLCETDSDLALVFTRHIARVAMSRLHETRIQLAAARA
ncbi:MAG: Crp/Fnr family transcriptional regulator [Chloroflexi bacterium]|nr:Crp/Fnr family transcriptional regulator [Chloroflexota bacterium]